ncbi:biotin/lipoyl-binding protein, partial [Nostoc sp. NIES-2111]
IPSVAGEVTEVPVQSNVPLQRGDILFRIDPTTYEAQVRAIEAQLRLAEERLGQFTQLQRNDSGRAFDVQQREAERDQLRAQLDAAKWDLDRTHVRAP